MAKPAKSAKTPRFGVDKGQYGIVLVGRRFSADLTQSDVKAIHKTVEAHRTKTNLPLVFVSPGGAETDNDDSAGDMFYAGLLVAAAKDGDEPVEIDKSLLDPARLETIPDELWEALEEKHDLSLDEDDDEDDEGDEEDDEGPATGVFLAPGGWAVASLYIGSTDGDCLLTTSSEDTTVGAHLGDDLLQKIRDAAEPLLLVGAYC